MSRKQWENLIAVMKQEEELMEQFGDCSAKLRDGLYSRNRIAVEGTLRRMNSAVSKLESLEKARCELVDAITGAEQGIDALVSALPPDLRIPFHRARGALKAHLLRVQSRTRGISAYAESKARLIQEIMEELVPTLRGRIYNKQGKPSSAGQNPILLSRQL